MNKKNTLLLVLLVAQLAIIGFFYRPGQDQVAPATKFFEFQVPQVKGLTIVDDEGKSIDLVREDDGWLVGADRYPADEDTVLAILRKISEVRSARLVTRTRSSHVRLKVGEEVFNRKLSVVVGKNEPLVFYLGTAPNSKTIHFRQQGSDEVYVVKDLSSWELQADKDSWWRTKFIDMGMDQMTGLRLKNSSGVIALTKVDDEWHIAGSVPADKKVARDRLEGLVESVRKVTITEYLGKSAPDELGEPVARLDYTAGEKLIGLDIWPADEEGGAHLVKGSHLPFYAKVSSYVLKEALEAGLDGLLDPVEESNNQ